MEVQVTKNTQLDKVERYKIALKQAAALLEGEYDLIANMANLSALLKSSFELGPIACTRIGKGKGVCGFTAEKKETVIVPDVDTFPGHISCNSNSKSEIVVPFVKDNKTLFVLDVDSDTIDDFDETDKLYLEQLVSLLPTES